mgnify:FL=1
MRGLTPQTCVPSLEGTSTQDDPCLTTFSCTRLTTFLCEVIFRLEFGCYLLLDFWAFVQALLFAMCVFVCITLVEFRFMITRPDDYTRWVLPILRMRYRCGTPDLSGPRHEDPCEEAYDFHEPDISDSESHSSSSFESAGEEDQPPELVDESDDDSDDDFERETREIRQMHADMRDYDLTFRENDASYLASSDEDVGGEPSPPRFQTQASYASLFSDVLLSDADTVDMVEDLLIFATQLYRSQSLADISLALVVLVKARKKGPITHDISSNPMFQTLNRMFKECGLSEESLLHQIKTAYATQSGTGDNEPTSSLNSALSAVEGHLVGWRALRGSPIFAKLYEFLMYVMSYNLLDQIGVDFNTFNFSKMHAAAVQRKYSNNIDFAECMIDTILYICKAGQQVYATGRVSSLYHSGATYEDFLASIVKVETRVAVMDSMRDDDHDPHTILAHIETLHAQGMDIYRLAEGTDKKFIEKLLYRLQMADQAVKLSNQAREFRTPPWSMLLFGPSGTGKTTFIDYLYGLTCAWLGMARDTSGKFVVNPAAKFWDGFTSRSWFIVLDELASELPDKVSSLKESSVANLLLLCNPLPFCPDQASLEKKGTVPAFPKVLIGTTNELSLNAERMYSCPEALRRRLPFCVRLEPHPRFCKGGMLDKKLIMADPIRSKQSVPDVWDIYVYQFVANIGNAPADPGIGSYHWVHCAEKSNGKGEYYALHADASADADCLDMRQYLVWMKHSLLTHHETHKELQMQREAALVNPVCDECGLPASYCLCQFEAQMGVESCLWLPLATFLSVMAYNLAMMLTSWMHRQIWRKLLEALFDRVGWWIRKGHRLTKAKVKTSIEEIRDIGDRIRDREFKPPPILLGVIACISAASFIKWWQNIASYRKQSSDAKKPDVWKVDEVNIETLSKTPQQACTSLEQIKARVSRNVAYIEIDSPTAGPSYARMVHTERNCWLTTSHSIPDGTFELSATLAPPGGVSINRTIRVSSSDVHRHPEKDLCMLYLPALLPRRSISDFFMDEKLNVRAQAHLLGRDEEGDISDRLLGCATLHKGLHIQIDDDITDNVSLWLTCPLAPTRAGDCGSPLILEIPGGFAIGGLHVAWNSAQNQAAAVPVTHQDIAAFLAKIRPLALSEGHVALSRPSCRHPPSVLPLSEKSPLRYLEDGVASVHGTLDCPGVRYRSKVGPTPAATFLAQRGIVSDMCAPLLSGWKPPRIALLALTNPVSEMDQGLVTQVAASFLHDILEGIDPRELAKVRLLTDHEALNGLPGVRFIDAMKKNTSMGFPYNEPKNKHLLPLPPDEDYYHPVVFPDEVYQEMRDIEATYRSGTRYHPVFKCHLKDEPVKPAKRASGKTRVFAGAPVGFSMVVRQRLLSLVKMIQENPFLFESAPGINPMSHEWFDLFQYVTTHGVHRIIAGDYGKFDKRMASFLILASFGILFDILKRCPNYDYEEEILRGIATDTAYPTMDFFGTFLTFVGSNPSGHPLTVIINGIANSLYMRYCYATLNPAREADSFKSNVSLITYGDDNIMSVSENISWFDHTKIVKVLADIDVEYTMADKTSESVPFIHIDEGDFLKRKFQLSTTPGICFAPLDTASIEKSLCVWVKSKTVTSQEQYVSIVQSALREYFQHGPEIYDKMRALLRETLTHLGYIAQGWAQDSLFISYETIMESCYPEQCALSN